LLSQVNADDLLCIRRSSETEAETKNKLITVKLYQWCKLLFCIYSINLLFHLCPFLVIATIYP